MLLATNLCLFKEDIYLKILCYIWIRTKIAADILNLKPYHLGSSFNLSSYSSYYLALHLLNVSSDSFFPSFV